jgi:hypothetical protein
MVYFILVICMDNLLYLVIKGLCIALQYFIVLKFVVAEKVINKLR